MIASTTVDTIWGVIGFQIGILVAVIVLIGRLWERVAKIQEWIRIYERKNGNGRSGQ